MSLLVILSFLARYADAIRAYRVTLSFIPGFADTIYADSYIVVL